MTVNSCAEDNEALPELTESHRVNYRPVGAIAECNECGKSSNSGGWLRITDYLSMKQVYNHTVCEICKQEIES